MSLRFPFSLVSDQELSYEEAIAANYIQIITKLDSSAKLLRLAEIFWPIFLIQAEPNYKLVIDTVGMQNFQMTLVNAPRTAQVGHVLRDPKIESVERLDLVHKVLRYEKTIQLNNSSEDKPAEEEFINKSIKGLITPDLIEGFARIFNHIKPFDPNEYLSLDMQYNFENALEFAQEWNETLKNVQGNRLRWKSVKDMIAEPYERWVTDLNVKKKDIEEIYKKKRAGVQDINEKTIQSQLDSARDNVDQSKLQEQKQIIEKIGKMYMGVNIIVEDLLQRNRYFLNLDTLKTQPALEVIDRANQSIDHYRTSLQHMGQQLDLLASKINQTKIDLEQTNITARNKIESLNSDLKNRKLIQENEIIRLSKEKEQQIQVIQELLTKIQSIQHEIEEFIDEKIKRCKFDEINLQKWQIEDNISKITKPTLKMHIPIGVAILQDQEENESLSIFLPTIYTTPKMTRIPITPGFTSFETELSKKLEKDMRLRSNFEFTCEKAPNYVPLVITGLSGLNKKNYISDVEKKEIIARLIS